MRLRAGYICQIPAVVRASAYEGAVDELIEKVLGQLRAEGIAGSNLEVIWKDVLQERVTAEAARHRKFEALIGRDPDEADEGIIQRLVEASGELGEGGVQELAAARAGDTMPATSSEIKTMAKDVGFESNPREVVRLEDKSHEALPVDVPAWKRGVAAAKALREQERLGAAAISNDRLCQSSGVSRITVGSSKRSDTLSFALDEGPTKGAVVLRSRYETGRRFDLARLLGDRIAALSNGPLKPATRTYTYRQKLQRSFAGEFLCPFDALADTLREDFSDEAIQDAASHFNVSVLTVRTLLVNHGLPERESLTDQFDFAA